MAAATGALAPAMLKPRGESIFSPPTIFSQIFACCSLKTKMNFQAEWTYFLPCRCSSSPHIFLDPPLQLGKEEAEIYWCLLGGPIIEKYRILWRIGLYSTLEHFTVIRLRHFQCFERCITHSWGLESLQNTGWLKKLAHFCTPLLHMNNFIS